MARTTSAIKNHGKMTIIDSMAKKMINNWKILDQRLDYLFISKINKNRPGIENVFFKSEI